MMKNSRTATCTTDPSRLPRAYPGSGQLQQKPIRMTQQMTDKSSTDSRRGVRRTVTILVTVVLAFFALSFVQIMLMK